VIGLPIPGCELKLVNAGGKLEVRVKGPHVTPGYWQRPELTAASFDEEGFYRIGDAVRFVDVERPERGVLFDGRVSEDFKLDSGTWVNVGLLRVQAIAALAPVAQDAVLTGHDRSEVGLLVFPNVAACRELAAGLAADAPLAGGARACRGPRARARGSREHESERRRVLDLRDTGPAARGTTVDRCGRDHRTRATSTSAPCCHAGPPRSRQYWHARPEPMS
jgi:feruloyl-CoA synthase